MQENKIGLKELVWMGFNYICGIGFPMSFHQIISSKREGVGLHILWIIALGAIFAASSGLAFVKCSQIYPKSNGAAYVYTRSNFGRYVGWMIGVFQYIFLPAVSISWILSMLTLNLKGLPVLNGNPLGGGSIPLWGSDPNGAEIIQDLFLNIIGIVFFVIASSSILIGIKWFRYFFHTSAVIKWFATLFVILCGIILMLSGNNLVNNFRRAFADTQPLKLGSFYSAFTAFFFFYLGFEVYSSVTKNIQDPEKNIGRSIFIVLLLTTLFYLLVTVIMFASLGSFKDNKNPNNEIVLKVAGIAGIVVLIIALLSLKINGVIQNSLYAGGMLEPLAVEGYIGKGLAKLNKEGIAARASLANLVISVSCSIIFLVLPLFFKNNTSYADVIGFSVILVIIVHLAVLFSAIKLYFNKHLNVRKWEMVMWILTIIFLISILIYFFYNKITNFFDEEAGVINQIQIIMVGIFFLIPSFWYYFYYRPKHIERAEENPLIQKKLDKAFVPVPGESGPNI